MCKGLSELYENFKIFFDELGLWSLQYYLAADFQAINIPLGLQGFSAKYWSLGVGKLRLKRTLLAVLESCPENFAKEKYLY